MAMEVVIKKMKIIRNKNGQTMLIVTVLIGGLFIIGTGIAGLLMYLTLRNTSDVVSSNAAIFAADAGMERALYCYFKELSNMPQVCTSTQSSEYVSNQKVCNSGGSLSNGASVSYFIQFTCSNKQPVKFIVTSYGYAAEVVRVLERTFDLK